MTIRGDVQAKHDLLAIRSKVLVVAALKLNRFRIRIIIFANERHGGAVIVNFVRE